MKFKTSHFGAALALSAGLLAVTQANAIAYLCESSVGASPSCTTNPVPVKKGAKVYLSGATLIRGDTAGGIATLTLHNGVTTVFSKRISSPFSGQLSVTNDNRAFSASIVAQWNDPDWLSEKRNGIYSKVKAGVSTAPISLSY